MSFKNQRNILKTPLKFLALFFIFLGVFSYKAAAEEDPSGPFKLGAPLFSDKEQEERLKKPPWQYDQTEWNRMRRTLEQGREPGEIPITVDISSATDAGEPPKPPPGQISFDLPYESNLTITGRKVIRMELENKHISSERAEELGTAQDTQSFDLEQELQARIQGTVARKTTINVNFDDTKENVRDFQVIYTGDPDEVVQEAAFGDIVLSLPSTEFVNYNKQLFGIRAKLKYKRLGFQVIGSRTKGTTETKRFTGSTERFQKYVPDTSYLRRKYYDLTFSSASAMVTALSSFQITPLNSATPETVYLEDTTGDRTDAQNYLIATPTAPVAAPNPIRMRILSPGVDYSIDRIEGVINFNITINEGERVAINFGLNNGTTLVSATGVGGGAVAYLIKDATPEAPQVSQEIKRFYSIGARNIVPDNGLRNFVLKLQDKSRENNDIGETLNPTQLYPDNIDVNFESGIFELNNRIAEYPEIYASNVVQGTPLQAEFFIEYQAIKRTFTLRPNIVLQSETVEVDGRRLNRDLDYFIDYDIGILTFFNDDVIRESTEIEVTYEFAPFGGQLGETLVGARGTYDILNNQRLGFLEFENWSVGSTVLYNFAARPTSPPDIRSTPSSLLVTEGDTKIETMKWGKLPITSDLELEVAQSNEDPNLFGRALIDSMEGVKQEDSASLLEDSWQIAASPVLAPYNTISDFRGMEGNGGVVAWRDVDVDTRDLTDDSAQQKALAIDFNLNPTQVATPEQISVINVMSIGGRDFSKKSSFELELFGAGATAAGAQLLIEYGTFNENADGDTILDTEDTLEPRDGVLNLGEDIGWEFNGPTTTVRVGAGNTRLDTEDLNADKALNTVDQPATNSPIFELSPTSSQTGENDDGSLQTGMVDLSFTGRRLFKINFDPQNLSQAEQDRLLAVKQLRLTIRNASAGTAQSQGTIVISRLSMVGNTWEPAEFYPEGTASFMAITGINNKDDVTYPTLNGHPGYSNLYKDNVPDSDSEEQALALNYIGPSNTGILPMSTATTKVTYGGPRDFSDHESFKFFVRKRNADSVGANACTTNCGTFFLRAGSETQWQEVQIDITAISQNQWDMITIRQVDTNNDGTPETWVSDNPNASVVIRGGIPDLTNISQLSAGVYNTTSQTLSNEIWLNEIHLTEANKRKGTARRYKFDTAWEGWMNFGGTYRKVDRNFQTPTTAITNQDNTQSNAYIDFNRLSFLPMSFSTNRQTTITPSAFRSNQNALVSTLEEGEVDTINNKFTAKLVIPKLPIFDFNYNDSKQEANLTQRDDLNQDWRLTGTYNPTVKWDLFPGDKLSFRPLPTSITVSRAQSVKKLRFSDVDSLLKFGISTAPFESTNKTQFSEETDIRLAFKLWDGFTFNPRYLVREETEKLDFRTEDYESSGSIYRPELQSLDETEIPRSFKQEVSFSGNLRLLKWLDPRYNYSFNGNETNKIPTLNNTTNYELKTITRNSNLDVSAPIQINRIFPKFKPTQSMSFNPSYRLQNGDKYEDVPNGFDDWKTNLWVADSLNISSGTDGRARRTELSELRTFRNSLSWNPFSGYRIEAKKWKPLSSLSLTGNYQQSIDERETDGSFSRTESTTWPDLIFSLSDSEDFVGIPSKYLDDSRLTIKTNTTKRLTVRTSKSKTDSLNLDYLFKVWKKLEFSTGYNTSQSRTDNLVIGQLESERESTGYSIQTSIPWRAWRFTPRYDRQENNARDAFKTTDDLVVENHTLQIYADLTKPLGLRIGRREFGLQNRMILNSNLSWEKKRSSINPNTNYLDIYSATLSGDYTINKNFRLAIGGNFQIENYHPDFSKNDTTTFGIDSTLTIQF